MGVLTSFDFFNFIPNLEILEIKLNMRFQGEDDFMHGCQGGGFEVQNCFAVVAVLNNKNII